MVVFGQGGCILEKVIVFGQKMFHSGKSGCIRAKWLCSGKNCSIRPINLYSGKNGCIRARWLCLGISGCIRAKVYLFR